MKNRSKKGNNLGAQTQRESIESFRTLILAFSLLLLIGTPTSLFIYFYFDIFLVKLFLCLIFLTLSIFSMFGVFSPSYHHYAFGMSFPPVQGQDQTIPWSSFIRFTTKGAFVAGRKIHVKAEFLVHSPEMLKDVQDLTLMFTMDQAWKFPLTMLLPDTNIIAGPELHKTIKDRKTTIEGNIVYSKPGTYGYGIIIFNPRKGEQMLNIFHEDAITISPHEVETQIRNNNLIIAISWIGILFALLQLLRAI